MLMLDSTPAARSVSVNHAVAQTWAPGVTLQRWEEPAAHGATLLRESAGLSLTHRLHRWNLPQAQANLWLVGEAGQLRRAGGHGRSAGEGGYGALAFMADYETTRVYAGSSLKLLRSGGGLLNRLPGCGLLCGRFLGGLGLLGVFGGLGRAHGHGL